MTLTDKHNVLSKNKVIKIIIYFYALALFNTQTTAAKPVENNNNFYSNIISAENSQKLLLAVLKEDKKNAVPVYLAKLNTQKHHKGKKIIVINQNKTAESLNEWLLLSALIIMALGFLALSFWRRNMALRHESLQIKSELDQYHTIASSNDDIKLIQEEHRQQVLALNDRQQKIVDLMAFGYSNKQIADKLFISENTVKYHIKNIYHVLHVKDRKTLWLTQS